jgi:hypothetical protein
MSLDPRICEVRGKGLILGPAIRKERLHRLLECTHVLGVRHAVQEVQHALPALCMGSSSVFLLVPSLNGLAVFVRWRELKQSTCLKNVKSARTRFHLWPYFQCSVTNGYFAIAHENGWAVASLRKGLEAVQVVLLFSPWLDDIGQHYSLALGVESQV